MVGAIFAAPLAGALADRFGRRRELLVVGLATDAVLLFALSFALRDLSCGKRSLYALIWSIIELRSTFGGGGNG